MGTLWAVVFTLDETRRVATGSVGTGPPTVGTQAVLRQETPGRRSVRERDCFHFLPWLVKAD